MTERMPIKKRRVLISAIAWLLCVPVILLNVVYLLSLLNVAPNIVAHGEFLSDPGSAWVLVTLPLSAFAWSILAFMTFSWIDNRKVHWLWCLLGTFCASAWWAPMGLDGLWMVMMYVGPGVLLACYLNFWHICTPVADPKMKV